MPPDQPQHAPNPRLPDATEPRLTVELVPKPCWWSNVRSIVDPPVWDQLRRKVYRQCGWRCEICGGRGPEHPVEAHEVWAYDDEQHVQRLVRLTGLCPPCHEVKHIGLAGVRGHGERAQRHLAAVNGWTEQQTDAYLLGVFDRWYERNRHIWRLELDGLGPYLDDHLELRRIRFHLAMEQRRRKQTNDHRIRQRINTRAAVGSEG
jgi:hypothetical protein